MHGRYSRISPLPLYLLVAVRWPPRTAPQILDGAKQRIYILAVRPSPHGPRVPPGMGGTLRFRIRPAVRRGHGLARLVCLVVSPPKPDGCYMAPIRHCQASLDGFVIVVSLNCRSRCTVLVGENLVRVQKGDQWKTLICSMNRSTPKELAPGTGNRDLQ